MNFEECLEKGAVRKAVISDAVINKQIKIAETQLKKAESFLSSGEVEAAAIFAYLSLFHSFRALLFRKGYKERSHYCVFQFAVDRIDGPLAQLAQNCQYYREARHNIQYEGEEVTTNLVEEMVSDANKAILMARKYLKI